MTQVAAARPPSVDGPQPPRAFATGRAGPRAPRARPAARPSAPSRLAVGIATLRGAGPRLAEAAVGDRRRLARRPAVARPARLPRPHRAERDRGAAAGTGGDAAGRGAVGPGAAHAAAAADDRRGDGRRRIGPDEGGVVQPAVARRAARPRGRACWCTASSTRLRLSRSRRARGGRARGDGDPRRGCTRPASSRSTRRPSRLRATEDPRLGVAGARPGARTRSRRFPRAAPRAARVSASAADALDGGPLPRRRRGGVEPRGSGSPSRSCSCTRPRSPRAAGSTTPRGARRRPLDAPGELTAGWLASLPFELTGDQRARDRGDRRRPGSDRPMQRLLMGEVGSGKTVCALYAMLRAVESGHQAALMAPTETLAEQHFADARAAARRGAGCRRRRLLTGSTSAARRREHLGHLASGQLELVVGTHALIEPDVEFARLALAVVDEQHRFGVRQRAALDAKGPGDAAPHTLHMTATPIPRTLSLTAYGDLDVTALHELPAGRRAGQDVGGGGGEARRRLRVHPRAPARGPPGVRRLPACRGVRQAPGARRDEGGRAAREGGVPRLRGRRPARPDEGVGQAARDGGLRIGRDARCSSRRA